MCYITKSVTIIITLYTISSATSNPYPPHDSYSNNSPNIKKYTRNISLRQGTLQGVVFEPKINRNLPLVEVYRGIPYATPPVGEMRFMPPRGAPSWTGIKYADTFGPVCPQKFPDERNMSPFRKTYFSRLKEYLQNQSEDCLYLNIYAPHQESGGITKKYAVMVYIHGESFEWNSGNPYDGSVLSAYGNVIVVTLNFRLGILGFLKAGTEELSNSNFGLVDQIAALVWVKDNIEAFGGDLKAITLFGHGTGAVCVSLLTISPMILQDEERLFQRAILMGGTALADWALAGNPNAVTYQVSQALNCQVQDDFASCLRRKRLDEIMAASAITPPYETRFGPIVDSLVVPNDPKKSMTQHSDIFKNFELMYGVTEQESIHLLGSVALIQGMLEKERDQELRNYVHSRCEMKPERCFMRTLSEYTDNEFTLNDQQYGVYTGHEPDRASLARDALLDILSDARSVAPIVQMARYHAALNMQSYFYVFTHKTHSKEYIRNKSFHGEELPYVFGVPFDGPRFHFNDSYTQPEKLFSEIVMTYFCNFAKTGNPNVPRTDIYYTLSPAYWTQYDIEWPEFDAQDERYLQLDIPPQPSDEYREKQVNYWINTFPKLGENQTIRYPTPKQPTTEHPSTKLSPKKNPPPWIRYGYDDISHRPSGKTHNNIETLPPSRPHPKVFGTVARNGNNRPSSTANTGFGIRLDSPPEEVKQASTINMVVIIGGLILLANVLLLLILYFKCYKKKKISTPTQEVVEVKDEEKGDKSEEEYLVNGCNIVRMISKSSKTDDNYTAVKSNGTAKNQKLTRQMSTSTIDAHTKVRDWITQEIVYKYSPRFVRRPKLTSHSKIDIPVHDDAILPVEGENYSTLGRSPTRPVSPTEGLVFQQPAMKTSTVTRPKTRKPAKVSVAIDATPLGRGDSVLMQQPIELTKSLDYPYLQPDSDIPLRRSITLEDFSPRVIDTNLRKSTTSINLKYTEVQPTVIKIEHGYSKSEPVQDLNYTKIRKLRTFDPNCDVNVTSRDDDEPLPPPLSAEESLMVIKRRKFPKVLPDHPGREAFVHKRRSMPAHGMFLPIPESSSFSQPNSPTGKNFAKAPPMPPPRMSTLSKQSSNPLPMCVSEPTLIEDSYVTEPEIVCNNLYVGPLVPKSKSESKGDELNIHPIYESLRNVRQNDNIPTKSETGNSNSNVRRADPKFVVRPSITRKLSDDKPTKNIPRVIVPDNQPHAHHNFKPVISSKPKSDQSQQTHNENIIDSKDVSRDFLDLPNKTNMRNTKKSQIPTPVKSSNPNINKESSSSDSPSEGSDTGTVVKKM